MGRFGINRDSYGFEIPDIYNNAASGYTFSAEYQTVYDTWAVKPAADIAQQQDIMVRALVAGGYWTTRDGFYIIANVGFNESLTNWINPGTYDILPVVLAAGDFVAYRGITGNAVNGYLRTQINPRTVNAGGGNIAQNDTAVSIYIRTNSAADVSDFGVRDTDAPAARLMLRSNWSTNTTFDWINDNTADSNANGNSSGMFVSNRIAANSKIVYRNSAVLVNDVTASVALPNDEMFIAAYNINGGGVGEFSGRQYAHFSMGASFDEVAGEVTDFTNIINTYMTYIGANTF